MRKVNQIAQLFCGHTDKRKIKNTWQSAARMFAQRAWEQQSHSHGSVSGTAKVSRTAGNRFSLQQTPDVRVSLALPVPFLLQCPPTSLPSERVKKRGWEGTGCVVFHLWNWLFLWPTVFMRFPTLCPRCGQSGEEATKATIAASCWSWRWKFQDFGKVFLLHVMGTVFVTLHPSTKKTTKKRFCFFFFPFYQVVLFLWWSWCGDEGENQASTKRRKKARELWDGLRAILQTRKEGACRARRQYCQLNELKGTGWFITY